MVHLQGSFQQAPFLVRCVCVGGGLPCLLGSKRRRDQDPMIVGRLRVVGARNTTCTSMKPVACDQRIYEFLLTFFRSRSKSSEHGRNEYCCTRNKKGTRIT